MADFLAQAMARSATRARHLPQSDALARNPGAFRRALEAGPLLIAEVKRASPSKGPIRPDADAAAQARAYGEGGAGAISALTEPDWFAGSLQDLRAVRAAVGLPILRKDFIADPRQIAEAAEAGADAVLLIVAALDDASLRALLAEATARGLDALVEVHDAPELARAAQAGAHIIGVNNRNLGSLQVGDAAAELASQALPGTLLVAESGIRTPDDIRRYAALGYRGFLVGETLMRADDPEAATRALVAAIQTEPERNGSATTCPPFRTELVEALHFPLATAEKASPSTSSGRASGEASPFPDFPEYPGESRGPGPMPPELDPGFRRGAPTLP